MSQFTLKTVAHGIRMRVSSNRKYKGKLDKYFTLRYSLNGKQREEGLGWASQGWTITKASIELAKLKVAQITGQGHITLKEKKKDLSIKRNIINNSPTLKSLWEQYKTTLKKSSYQTFISITNCHLKEILQLKVNELCTKHIDNLCNQLKVKNLSPQSIKHALAIIRQIIRWGAKHGYCEIPPIHQLHFTMPKFDNTRTEFLNKKQIKTLLKAIDLYENKKLALAMKLALFTGMRRSAIFALKWKDIDFEKKSICLHAESSKNSYTSYIPMTKNSEKILKNIFSKKVKSTDLVFEQINSYSYSIKNFMKYIKNYLPNGYRPWHCLRHTFASQIASSGKADLLTLQKLLTHKSPVATQRYAHIADSILFKTASIMDKVINDLKRK